MASIEDKELKDLAKRFKYMEDRSSFLSDANSYAEKLIKTNEIILKNTKEIYDLETRLYSDKFKHIDDYTIKEYKNLKLQKEQLNLEIKRLETLGNVHDLSGEVGKRLFDQYEAKKKEVKILNEEVALREKAYVGLEEVSDIIDDINIKRKKTLDTENEIRNAVKQESLERSKLVKIIEKTNKYHRGTKEVLGGALNLVKGLLNPWAKVDQNVASYARNVGLNAKGYENLRRQVLDTATETAAKFGISGDELIKIQQNYNNQLGRSVRLTSNQQTYIAAIQKMVGDDKMAVGYAKFGVDVESVANRVSKLFNKSLETGVVFSEVSKNVADNIAIAQNYTFKNGLRGLEEMAIKSAQTSMNMKAVASFADKLQSVEGAVSAAANLQVLGGDFATYSNPLNLLYKGLNDMNGLQDDMVKMVSKLGRFNKKTGEVEFSPVAKQQMKVASSVMGVSYEDLHASSQRSVLRDVIGSQINGRTNIDDNLKELIKNTAQYVEGKGFGIANQKGEFKSVKDLNKGDVADLKAISNKDSDNLKDIAYNTQSMNERFENVQKAVQAYQAKMTDGLGSGMSSILKELSNMGAMLQLFAIVNMGAKVLDGLGQIGRPFTRGGAFNRGYKSTPKLSNKGTKTGKPISGGGAKTTKGWGLPKGKIARGIGKGGLIGIAGMGVNIAQDVMRSNGSLDEGSVADSAMGFGGGALTGAGFGAMLGSVVPVVGTVVGGIIGGLAGGLYSLWESNSERTKQLQDKLYAKLNADIDKDRYNEKELDMMVRAKDKKDEAILSGSMIRKLRQNGDYDRIVSSIREGGDNVTAQPKIVPFAKGGLIQGRKHTQGGIGVMGSRINVEGGEFIVNADSTRSNLDILSKINNSKINVKETEPFGKILKVNPLQNQSLTQQGKLKLDPININISGNINIGGQPSDITNELTKNPLFLRAVTELIIKQVNMIDNSALNKDTLKRKF